MRLDKGKIKFIVFVLILAVSIILSVIYKVDFNKLLGSFKAVPLIYSVPVFLILFITSTFFLWHIHEALYAVAALVYGLYLSTGLIYAAHIANAYLFFKLSRSMGKEYVEKRLQGKYKGFYEKMEKVSFGWLFLLRMMPFVPYRVWDLSFGLTKYPLRKYMTVALLASLPRIFLIQFGIVLFKDFLSLDTGAALQNLISPQAGAASLEQNSLKFTLFSLAFLVYLIVGIAVFIKFRKDAR